MKFCSLFRFIGGNSLLLKALLSGCILFATEAEGGGGGGGQDRPGLPKRSSSDEDDSENDSEIDTEAVMEEYDPHWSYYEDDDDAEGEEREHEFGQTALKVTNEERQHSRVTKDLVKGQRSVNGTYLTTAPHTCQGKECGLRCHEKKAMAYVEREIYINGYLQKKRLCWLCEYEYFHKVEPEQYTAVDKYNIIKSREKVYYKYADGSFIEIVVTGGDLCLLYDWLDKKYLTIAYSELGEAEDLQTQLNNMIERHLFADYYPSRRLYTSGIAAPETNRIMNSEPLFKDMFEYMGGEGNIFHNWCQLGDKGSYQDYHSDKFFRKDAANRNVWSLGVGQDGNVQKMMTIADRKSGKWCSFLVPHSTIVSMSKKGSGSDSGSKHLQHRVDFCEGVFCFITETKN
jgi:hypothetical protein